MSRTRSGDGSAGDRAGRLVTTATGGLLGAGFALAARVRHDRPIHTNGAVLHGRLRRGLGERSGIEWLDAPAEDDVVVRYSRGGGLPATLPDVHGLALRLENVDLLLTTTGTAPLLRHVLRPGWDPGRAAYTSVWPFRGPSGPVMIGLFPGGDGARRLPPAPRRLADAVTASPLVLILAWAGLVGPWRPVGTLHVTGPSSALDPALRFDPARAPTGVRLYDWMAQLRTPAYRAARRPHDQPHLLRSEP